MLYERIKKERARLEEQIRELQRKMDRLPGGKLICAKGVKGYRWYQSDGHQKTRELMENHPGYQELLQGYFLPEIEEFREWMLAPYDRNTTYSENLIHKTSMGSFVRSKSEAMITHFLFTHQIPFRYECALHLEETIIYPDFTIRHPVTGKLYY